MYSQLYVYDHSQACEYQKGLNPKRDPDTMEKLQTMQEECHPHVDVYVQAFHLMQNTTLTDS